MQVAATLDRILQAALAGRAPARQECVYLLGLPEDSIEAGILKSVADYVSRKRFGNRAVLLAQIGIDIAACPGNCAFCVFGKNHTRFEPSRLSLEEIVRRAREFADGGDLYALFLMTMHEFSMDWLLRVVETVRGAIPSHTRIVVNIGDFDAALAAELRSAGVSGVYHVCRLREGTDTSLDPVVRRRTLGVIRETGLDLYYCCEPIGPEHTLEEMVEQLFLGIDCGCFQHAAMRRVRVESTPLSRYGQITERRLAQAVAVVALATLECAETGNIAVHEPNLLGLAAGANAIYAESGANPRDSQAETEKNRGQDVTACRKMLYEAGFSALQTGDGSVADLAPDA